jgi:hypothetical protein
MTIEAKITIWISNIMYPEMPKQMKENIIIDHLVLRYERILRLRELARKEAAQNTKFGHPYNVYKIKQADHLLQAITQRLNERPIYHQIFNMN